MTDALAHIAHAVTVLKWMVGVTLVLSAINLSLVSSTKLSWSAL